MAAPATAAVVQSIEQFKGQPRLPLFAVPKRYGLTLRPDLSACKFSGSVEIAVDVVAETHFIVLNAAELEFTDGAIWFRPPGATQAIRPSQVVALEADELLVLGFDAALPLGLGILGIGFSGTLNDQMKGFYRSMYEINGEKKNMAVTQFEPADARRCFPCWDEPVFKATFKIVLEVPADLVALSNMPVVEENISGSLKTLIYQESPIMSTYLVAVVVGLFDHVEGKSTDGTKVRVYCQVGKSDQGKFALDVAVRTLPLYKKYFDAPYSLPKLDMVAIPDFAAGAMENYGLVTYRETALLYDEQHSAAANKQRVASVVAHELAHQWFGNLVTMEWWTHLWLNEGFATWVSYLANDALFPEWKVWVQFLDETMEGLRLDALAESHPIEVEINHASQIDEIFDSISYCKGASVIRMLQSYLGADCFQKALASYIKRYACSNAKTEDLWAVLEEESGEPVKMLMNSWTKQKGYPVLDVKLKGQSLEIEQSQFLSNGSSGDGQWIVPVTVCYGSYESWKRFLLKSRVEQVDISDLIGSKVVSSSVTEETKNELHSWIKINVDQTGFYRVNYDAQLSTRLAYAIEGSRLIETDRLGILDDSFALCMAGKQTLSSFLSLMYSYREEREYVVLSHLISIIQTVARICSDAAPEIADDVKKFFVNLLKIAAEKLGWDPKNGESHLDAMLRGEILAALAVFGDESTQKEAFRRFSAFVDDRSTPLLPPDIRKAAYIGVMRTVRSSNKSGYESLLRVYRETDLSQEKGRILSSLASSPDEDIVLEALNFLLSSEVRNQDAVYGLAGISKEGREVAWKWLKDNWDHVSKTWGSGFLITRFVGAVVSPFSSDEKAVEIGEFFATRTKPSIVRTLKQSIERVRIHSNWVHSIRNEATLAAVVKELAFKHVSAL